MKIIISQFGEVYTDIYHKSTNIEPGAQKRKTHMKHSKFFLTAIFIAALLILISVLLATNSTTEAVASQDNSNPESQIESRNFDQSQEKPIMLDPSNTTSTILPTPAIDAESLQEQYCSQCHIIQWIEQIKKSRAEWESTLVQMEKMGVSLKADEKVILLDFLADTNQP